MTTYELIFVSASIGITIGLLIGWRDRRMYQKEIEELEAWNKTALVQLCEAADENDQLKLEVAEVRMIRVGHLESHECTDQDSVLEAEFVE